MHPIKKKKKKNSLFAFTERDKKVYLSTNARQAPHNRSKSYKNNDSIGNTILIAEIPSKRPSKANTAPPCLFHSTA